MRWTLSCNRTVAPVRGLNSGCAPRSLRCFIYVVYIKLELIMSLTIKSLLLSMAVLFVAGCNTMEGAGRDIQNAGEAVEHEAQH